MYLAYSKKKVKLTKSEMNRINNLKEMAIKAINPLEVKLYREEMNSIIQHAKVNRG